LSKPLSASFFSKRQHLTFTAIAVTSIRLLLCPVATVSAEESTASPNGLLTVSLSHTKSSGSYGLDDDTIITLTPLTVEYTQGPWFASVSIPFIRINGSGAVTMGATSPVQITNATAKGMPKRSGIGPANMGHNQNTTNHHQRSTISGIGDIAVGGGYGFFPFADSAILIELSSRVKFPTADEDKGLGTGEPDYSLQWALSLSDGRLQPFVNVGYTITGDPPLIAFNDILHGSLGATLYLTPDITATGAYSFQQKATDTVDNFQESSLTLEWALTKQWRTWATFAAGLSDATPDWSSGAGLAVSF